jgi:PEP-CTERM motif
VVIIPTANVSSFTKLGTGALLNGAVNHFQNTTSDTFSTDGGTYVSDLFELDPGLGSSTPSTLQGYFTLNNTGELDFTSAVTAVPEPGTYGLLTGGGLLLLSLHNRLFRKQT